MFTSNVQSNTRPEGIAYFMQPTGTAEVYLRDNIRETSSDEGPGYEYDEIYFQTEEAKENIEANLAAWKEYGAEWEPGSSLTPTAIIEKLQAETEQNRADIEYIAAMADIELEG